MITIRFANPSIFSVFLTSVICVGCGQGAFDGASAGQPPGAPTVEELAGATFKGISKKAVTLDDGRWEGEPFAENGASRPTISLVEHFRLIGDLNGDGREEAVVLLWESSGGSGTGLFLAVAGRHGDHVENLATAFIGDRVQVRAGWLAGDRVILDLIETGPDDAACCPTQKATKTWTFDADGLALTSTEVTGTVSVADLEGPEWVLTELGRGRPVADGAEITLSFEKNRVAGAGGCNRYFGTVNSTSPGELRFSGMGVTKRACPEPAMDLEQRYLSTLAGTTGYSFLAGRLALSCDTEDGPVTLIFAPRKKAPPGYR
jgi:heat shock protein HslJ